MTIDRKLIIEEGKSVIVLIILGIFMAWSGLGCNNCSFNTPHFWRMASLNALMWITLWKGNSYLADLISWKLPWIKFPVQRFVVGLIATIVYSLLAMYTIIALYSWQFEVKVSYSTGYSILITIIISLFMHGREFLINWRQVAIDAERLQKENIAAHYESLKSQINPHFLFNTLNVLTNVVYEDQDKAAKFIKQLSEVYRYVLDTRDREVVPLEEELKFLSSYLFLQQIRFADKLKLNIQLEGVKSMVAPLVLQMLIENAIKHNIVSEENPLTISVYTSGNFIVVENNLQKKMGISEDSTGIGLNNICKRYEFLSNTKVEINQNEKFIVKLPVIPVQA
jgi:hypothetical protein